MVVFELALGVSAGILFAIVFSGHLARLTRQFTILNVHLGNGVEALQALFVVATKDAQARAKLTEAEQVYRVNLHDIATGLKIYVVREPVDPTATKH